MSQSHVIKGVIEQLDEVLDWSLNSKSRLGYFAAFCRRFLQEVGEGVEAGRFEQGSNVEAVVAACITRYIGALKAYRENGLVSLAWRETFETTESRRRLVYQDLLLGLNASINFDLGIAAADLLRPCEVAAMEEDFGRLEKILCGLAHQVRREMHGISPWISLLDRLGKRKPHRFAQFNLSAACQSAFKVARDLAALNSQQKQELIHVLDRRVAQQARLPEGKGFLQRPLIWLARRRESRDVQRNIQALCEHCHPVSLSQAVTL